MKSPPSAQHSVNRETSATATAAKACSLRQHSRRWTESDPTNLPIHANKEDFMNLALWIIAIVLAAVFAGSGLMKQFVPKDKLVTSGQGWAQDFSPTSIRLIGLAEVLGAAGLILPAV